MDLRPFAVSNTLSEKAAAVLNYQPFVLSDEICTGAAYSWLHSGDGGRSSNVPQFVLRKSAVTRELWGDFFDANRRLANMYDDWIDQLALRFRGGSLLDVACNNGYFLVRAHQSGFSDCVGYDQEDYSKSVLLLNDIVGTNARFIHRSYDSRSHKIEGCEQYDVVVASNIMQHISDPLYFLDFVASRARKALFLFTGMGDEDEFRVYYSQPNRFYSYADRPFPICFDNDVGLSRGLLFKSLQLLGFSKVVEIPRKDTWLPESFLRLGCQKALLCLR